MFTVTCKNLMDELEFHNFKEFNKILECFHFDTFSSPADNVSKSLASDIAYTVRLKKLDWHKYKQKNKKIIRNYVEFKEASDKTKEEMKELLNHYYTKNQLAKIDLKTKKSDEILGVILKDCNLDGVEEESFHLQISDSLNILIGDRGAGKSALIELLGTFANLLSEKSMCLINKSFKEVIHTSHLYNRVRNSLEAYGINTYILTFIKDTNIYGYCINIKTNGYCLFIYKDSNWISLHSANLESVTLPKILLLNQDELMKISENKCSANLISFLDILNNDLYTKRMKLFETLEKFSLQYKNSNFRTNKSNFHTVESFIKDEQEKLYRAKHDLNNNKSVEKLLNHIWHYLKIIKDVQREKVINLLTDTQEKNMIYLYLGAIKDYLVKKLVQIQKLKNLDINKRKEYIKEIEIELKKEGLEEIVLDKNNDNEELSEYDLEFLKKFTDKETHDYIDYSELKSIVTIVINFLENRLDILSQINIIYNDMVILDVETLALIKNYDDLMHKREELLSFQKNICNKIDKNLNKHNINIKIFNTEDEYSVKFDITKLATRFHNINDFEIINSFTTFKYNIKNYTQLSNKILKHIMKITGTDNINSFLFGDIHIELLQNKEYVDFFQLTYGQKSAILLSAILLHTDSDIVLIDQPEDNLNIHSIINIMIPIIELIQKNKQLIIASNNSNFVLGLDSHITVLESIGPNINIAKQGSIREKEIILTAIEILEGGAKAFEKKISIYNSVI